MHTCARPPTNIALTRQRVTAHRPQIEARLAIAMRVGSVAPASVCGNVLEHGADERIELGHERILEALVMVSANCKSSSCQPYFLNAAVKWSSSTA